MNARTRILTIIIGLAVIAGAAWMAFAPSSELSARPYPGLVNQADPGLPEEVRAAWELQRNLVQAKIAQYPDAPVNYITLATYNRQLGEYAAARRAIEQALDMAPADRRAWTILGDIAANMGDAETAEYAYLAAQEIASDEAVYVKLASLYRGDLADERYHLIEELYQEAIRQHGQLGMFMTRLAEWYEDEGRYQDAIDHLEVVLSQNPEDQATRDQISALKQQLAR